MSGLKCKGLAYTSDSFLAMFMAEPFETSHIDPNGLILSKQDDFEENYAMHAVKEKKNAGISLSWNDLLKICKKWDEDTKYGKPFCCTGYYRGEFETIVQIFDATEVESQDQLKIDFGGEFNVDVYSEIVGLDEGAASGAASGAAGKLGVLTTILATMVFMN